MVVESLSDGQIEMIFETNILVSSVIISSAQWGFELFIFVFGHVLELAEHFDCAECSNRGHTKDLPLLQAVSSPVHSSELPVSIDYRESVRIGSWIFSLSELR